MAKTSLLKFKLKFWLRLLLILVILLEAWILYQYLYLNLLAKPLVAPSAALGVASKGIDERTLEEFTSWLNQREGFAISDYTLEGQTSGRENPFAETRGSR